MAVTPATFKIRFPEFDSTLDARIQLFIDDSIVILNESYWGDKYDLGVAYLSAHLLTMGTKSENGDDDAVSSIASQAVDGVSISFNSPAINTLDDAYYSSTAYGQRYLALRRTLGVPAFVI